MAGTIPPVAGAGASAATPYLLGAGMVMKAVSAAKERSRLREQNKADNVNKQRAKLQSAMAQLGSGIGSTGMA